MPGNRQPPSGANTLSALDRSGTWLAMLIATVEVVPAVILFLAVALYLLRAWPMPADPTTPLLASSGWLPLALCPALVTIVWAAAMALFKRHTSAALADARSFGMARVALTALAIQLNIPDDLSMPAAPGAMPSDTSCQKSLLGALTERNAAIALLRHKGTLWALAGGYMDVWTHLHRAEEAILVTLPCHLLIREALYDEQRLEGSLIPLRDELLDQLRIAVIQIDPLAAHLLIKQPRQPLSAVVTNAQQPAPGQGANPPQDPMRACRARLSLQTARQSLNEFQNQRFEGITMARNLLAGVTVLGGIVIYALLCVAITAGVSFQALWPVAVYYLVGTMAGIFNAAIVVLRSDTIVGDYGLTRTRLIATLTFAGIAAIGGVVAISALSGVVASAADGTLKNLADIYAFVPHNLVIAAVFGLAPSLLITFLQQQTDRYTSEIKSVQATQQAKS